MKVYSIGREAGCDILIHDATDVVSRRHAILNVASSGKMTIVDQSHNGTYVNGIRISPNVPVPVTRKDNISFAHVARLDWNMVPKTTTPMHYAIYGIIAVIVVVGAVFGYSKFTENPSGGAETVVADSVVKEQEKAKADSIHKADSIQKADSLKRDSLVKDSLRKDIQKQETAKRQKAESGKNVNPQPKQQSQPQQSQQQTKPVQKPKAPETKETKEKEGDTQKRIRA